MKLIYLLRKFLANSFLKKILGNQHQTNAAHEIRIAVQGQSIQLLRKLNGVRMLSTQIWLIMGILGLFSANSEAWKAVVTPLAVYTIIAYLINHVCNRSPEILYWSRYAPVAIDVWMLWYIQSRPIEFVMQNHMVEQQGFTIGVMIATFCLTIVFTLLTLSPRITFACFLVGGPLLVFSMQQLGIRQLDLIVGSLFLLAVMSFGANGVVHQILNLITSVINESAANAKLSRYFSPTVAKIIGNSRAQVFEGQSHMISVVFVDIRDFTQMSSSIEAKKVIVLLNRFFAVAAKTVFEFEGTLDKFLGDGILAYFGFLNQEFNHAERSIEFSFALQDRLVDLNRGLIQDGLPIIKIGIGINSGDAIVGSVGSLERMDFTIIGDTVNIACRIQELTKKYEVPILISQPTRDLSRDQFTYVDLGPATIRGKEGQSHLYSPLSAQQNAIHKIA